MRCVHSVSFSFKLNGRKFGHLVSQRGLRQRDPLSPYLFLMCAEGLSSLLHKAALEKRVSGLSIVRQSPPLTHLFFPDDSLLFFKAKAGEGFAISDCLKKFKKASGQLINYDKSVIAFSPNTMVNTKDIIRNILSVKFVDCHQQYMGLPSFLSRNKTMHLNFIKDRVWKHLQGWKSRLFSGGEEVLIEAVVQAIPCYSMSCFRIPKQIVNEINSLAARFL